MKLTRYWPLLVAMAALLLPACGLAGGVQSATAPTPTPVAVQPRSAQPTSLPVSVPMDLAEWFTTRHIDVAKLQLCWQEAGLGRFSGLRAMVVSSLEGGWTYGSGENYEDGFLVIGFDQDRIEDLAVADHQIAKALFHSGGCYIEEDARQCAEEKATAFIAEHGSFFPPPAP